MKFLVTGACGQLGHDLLNELKRRGLEGIGTDIAPEEVFLAQQERQGSGPSGTLQGTAEAASRGSSDLPFYLPLDITDQKAVLAAVAELRPDAVLHCAAWTAVDAAEDEENRPKVYAVNVTGTENLAEACRQADIPMTYISTDYVFDGQGTEPWQPDCTAYAPLNYYGETKLLGEKAVREALEKYFIVRIAWVFGRNGKNFIRTMLSLAENHGRLRVVSDQIGTPTYTYDLARLLVDMNLTDRYGTYHATNEGGFISWYEFTKEIFRQAQELEVPALSGSGKPVDYARVAVEAVTTAEYGLSKAARPFNSRLDKSKLQENGFTPLPDWKDALHRFLAGIRNVSSVSGDGSD